MRQRRYRRQVYLWRRDQQPSEVFRHCGRQGTWTITISADGVATIKSIAGNRDWLRYNNASNDLFACYASGQQDVSIYKLGYAGDAPQEIQATETNVAGIKNAANGDKLQIKGIVTNVYYTTIYILSTIIYL